MDRPIPPRRAFRLTLDIEADSREELAAAVRSKALEIDMDQLTRGVYGGYSSGGTYALDVDESITHDSWADALELYLAELDELNANKAAKRAIEVEPEPDTETMLSYSAHDAEFPAAPLARVTPNAEA